jgi:hypothetical protein
MGIHKLLPNLPGGNTATDTKYGLQKLNMEEHIVAPDAGTLLFECACSGFGVPTNAVASM